MAKTVYKAPALDKGLEILELLAGQPEPMAMPEIARKLGRSKTEIYRMLVVLETRGYIARGEHDDRYQATSRLFELGMRNPPTRNLHDAALPLMHELTERLLQSCHMGVIAGDHTVIIARVESPVAVGFSVRVGHLVPVLESASARIVFGTQSPARQAQWLKRLAKTMPKATLDQFAEEGRAAAKRGYLLEASRLVEGIRDIAAPVFDGESLTACLTVPYLVHRFAKVSIDDAIPEVVAAAGAITNRLRNG